MTLSASSLCSSLRLSALALGAAVSFAACGGGDSSDSGGGSSPQQLPQYVAGPSTVGFTPLVSSGGFFAFLADESTSGPGGTDYNGNNSVNDTVPVAVEAATQLEVTIGVAAQQIAWAGQNLYMVVDETVDGRNWIGPALDDLVLLHWAKDQPTTPLSTLDRRGTTWLVSTGDTVFFPRAAGEGGPMDSTLAAIGAGAPLTVVPVSAADGGGELMPTLLAADEGLVLASLDEAVHMRDLNGDVDMDDTNVLALLDGTLTPAGGAYPSALRNTGLASVESGATPYRASEQSDGTGWLVGLLVSEEAQGATNLNTINHPDIPASWVPNHCVGMGNVPDTDTDDDVLFFLSYTPWNTNPVANPPRNTGLVGKNRIAIVQNYVATVSQESEANDGFGEPCDLNGDGDRLDDIFRWVEAALPILPPRTVDVLFPPGDVPGGTYGIAELGPRWVLAVSEEADGTDFNGDDFFDLNIVGWFDPATSGGWTFDNGSPGNVTTAGATWMGEVPDRTRVGVGFSELANLVDLNNNNTITDSIATFAFYEEAETRLTYPGFGIATEAANTGVVIQNGEGFYRVSEADQGADINGNGTANDTLLWRSRLSDGVTVFMRDHNNVSRLSVSPPDNDALLGAFVVDESKAGDVNLDGREDGFAVVYYAWPQ